MEYNLLTEPWLKVKENGVIKKVGLRSFFENAIQYDDVVGLSELQTSEYEVYRFLITIFMDAYRDLLTSKDKVFDLYFENGFDMKRMEQYFNLCREEGCTFDLLDENRPFLQASKALIEEAVGNQKEKALAPAAIVCNHIPTATNTPFWGYIPENYGTNKKDISYPEIPLSEYVYWLIDRNCWMSSDGGTMNGPLNGPSTAVLVKGKNVFETIILNTPVVKSDASVPLWRMKGFYPEHIDILSGMFAPVRIFYPNLESVNEKNQTISQIYVSKLSVVLEKNGLKKKYTELMDHWVNNYEPHVVITKVKKDNKEFYKPVIFKVNRRGLFRICDALGITNEENKRFEEVGKVIYSRNIADYTNRVRDSLGSIDKARIAIYSSSNNHSSISWSLKQDSNGVEIDNAIFHKNISFVAYTIAQWCRKIGDSLSKSDFKLSSNIFNDECVNIFENAMKKVLSGEEENVVLSEAKKEIWNTGVRSFEYMKGYYHLGSSGGSFEGKGMKSYLIAKNEFLKSMKNTLNKKEEREES